MALPFKFAWFCQKHAFFLGMTCWRALIEGRRPNPFRLWWILDQYLHCEGVGIGSWLEFLKNFFVWMTSKYSLDGLKWQFWSDQFLLTISTWNLANFLELWLIPLIFNVHNVLRNSQFSKKWQIILKNYQFFRICKRNRPLQNPHF